MKRILYIILAAAAAWACSEDYLGTPAMSLFSEKPEVLEETAIFRLAVINMPDSTERRFPVTFGGSAEKGIDYEVSSEEFVYGGESPMDSIVVTTLKFGTGKTVSLSVEVPENMESGMFMTSGFTIQDIPAYIGFANGHKLMADSTYVDFKLTDKEGKDKALGIGAAVKVSVDVTKSTAVEGEDFEFPEGTEFIFAPGTTEGKLKVKKLKVSPDAGRDKIVLSMSHAEKFGEGDVRELEINLLDTLWKKLDGKWKIDTLVTDTTYMMTFWGEKCTGYDLLPVYKSTDAVRFDLAKGTFEPSFSSDFDLYFKGKSLLKKDSVMNLDLGDGRSAELQTFMLDNTNRYFSKSEVSEDKESLVGMRLIEAAEDGPDTLDFYVIDYVSKSFMPELDTLKLYAPEKPVAASPGQFLNITFVK